MFYTTAVMQPKVRLIFLALTSSFLYLINVLVTPKIATGTDNKLRKRMLDILSHPRCEWPPMGLRGRHHISREFPAYVDLNRKLSFMRAGHYKPSTCTPKERIAIIVPYRQREQQLRGFLDNIIPMLKRQQRDFTIYVAEQAPGARFNRGMMRNIGFMEAEREGAFDCYIFHDVDVIPEDDRNLYACGDNPRHLSGLMDRHNYTLLYNNLVGGIVAFRREHFRSLNGYSNQFFVWGGEDDELCRRLILCNLTLERPLLNVSHCSGLYHTKAVKEDERLEVLNSVKAIWRRDGLSELEYDLLSKVHTQLFRRIYATIDEKTIIKKRSENEQANRLLEIWKEKVRKREERQRLQRERHQGKITSIHSKISSSNM